MRSCVSNRKSRADFLINNEESLAPDSIPMESEEFLFILPGEGFLDFATPSARLRSEWKVMNYEIGALKSKIENRKFLPSLTL
jgi:hypothetical protein